MSSKNVEEAKNNEEKNTNSSNSDDHSDGSESDEDIDYLVDSSEGTPTSHQDDDDISSSSESSAEPDTKFVFHDEENITGTAVGKGGATSGGPGGGVVGSSEAGKRASAGSNDSDAGGSHNVKFAAPPSVSSDTSHLTGTSSQHNNSSHHHNKKKHKKKKSKMQAHKYSLKPYLKTAVAPTPVHQKHVALRKKVKQERNMKECYSVVKILCTSLVLFTFAGVTIILVLHFTGVTNVKEMRDMRMAAFRHSLPAHTNSAITDSPHSPQGRALDWLARDKKIHGQTHKQHGFHLKQKMTGNREMIRFVLATLYYATKGDQWSNNSAHGHETAWLQNDVHECGWDVERITCFHLGNDSPCDWLNGATCRLVKLNIPNMGLDGTLPPEIGMLSDLVELDLSDNNLQGSLPETIGDLTELRTLDLYENAFTGTLPAVIGNLQNLVNLDISKNLFYGELPPEIGQLSDNLVELLIQTNGFDGIPNQIGNLVNLEVLNLSNNPLDGPIPSIIGQLSKLQYFIAATCGFNGTIPQEVLSISRSFVSLRLNNNHLSGAFNFVDLPEADVYEHLEFLDLSHNHFNGPLPANNHHLFPKIKYLILDSNHFTGTIHPDVGKLTTLEALSCSRNRMSGTIPASLGQLESLRELVLYNDNVGDTSTSEEDYVINENLLSGVIPTEVCQLPEIEITVDCLEVPCGCKGCVCTQAVGDDKE